MYVYKYIYIYIYIYIHTNICIMYIYKHIFTYITLPSHTQLQEAVFCALTAVKDTNKYLTMLAPWHIKADPAQGASEEDADHRRQVCLTLRK